MISLQNNKKKKKKKKKKRKSEKMSTGYPKVRFRKKPVKPQFLDFLTFIKELTS